MKAIILAKLIVISFVVCSCTDTGKVCEEGKRIPAIGNNKFLFDSIYAVPLQILENNMLGDRIKVVQQQCGDIYVGEFSAHFKVFRFDRNGEYKNEIGFRGKGPGEYTSFDDFIVSADTVEILTGTGMQSRIVRYLNNGKFLSETQIDLNAISFEKMKSTYLFSTSYQKNRHSDRLYVTNLDGGQCVSFLPDKTAFNMPITEWKFTRSDTSVFFKEAFDNLVYEFNQGKLSVLYNLDFRKYSIPSEFFSKPMVEGFEMLYKQGFGVVKNYYETQEYSVFEILIQKKNDPSVKNIIIYNKKTGEIQENSILEKEQNCLGRLVGVTNSNELVYLEYPYHIIDEIDSFMRLPIVNKEILKDITLYDNPVLFYCKLKD
ncbi:hypothetical protein BZG01_10865 [Labilibaculum manganireducens]|uniref:6-bladed beta-propeller n=1 Tax=Labilibaculum manganireducens TaxID=1940525 RepID=A0A2N3I898_9BACT|nr:6-bladed beta-propeller [Labilibaculum manganireducens]PKQ66518.1 hypothetical protein BZG01_10865 [Labilibaculum manganireducens]